MPIDRRHADDDEADQQRDARAREHAREDVAPQLVEAEPVRAGRPFEPQRQLLRRRIERRDQPWRHGQQHDAAPRDHRGSDASPVSSLEMAHGL